MIRFACLLPIVALAACGAGEGDADGPGAASNGEIQALANAESMLESREDDAAEEEEGAEAE